MKSIITIASIVLVFSVSAANIQSNASGNWNNASTWIGGVIPTQNDTIEIINGHAISIDTDVSIHSIVITNGTISIGNYSLSIYGNITGQTNNISSTANSSLIINDSGSASIFDIPTNISKLKKLTINRTAGAQTNHSLDLDDAVPSDSIVLILTNGILYMNSGSIFYMNSQSIKRNIPCSDSSHIDGSIQRDIKNNSGFHVFPIGDNGIARPMSLASQNGTNNINQVQFMFALPPNNGNVNTSKLPGGIFQNFYWDHQLISSANTQRRLYYKDVDFPKITKTQIANSIYLANTSGAIDWDIPTTPRDVDTVNRWISFANSNASNDRYWTFGSDNIDVQIDEIVLPIELIYFEASLGISGIQLNWATASETNNEYFLIQRSTNGIDFNTISKIEGAGTSYNTLHYSFLDDEQIEQIIYYRLVQYDFNGKYSTSKIIAIENTYESILCDFIREKSNVWECKIKGNKNNTISYKILSVLGAQIAFESISLSNTNSIEFNLNNCCKSEKFVFIIVFIDNESFVQKIYIEH